jgi:uncharacterized protein CbrC (UPF0167 family)
VGDVDLPQFRYHPDPIETGSVKPSAATCACCERARGFVYTGLPYAEEEDLDGRLCPWCIADGSAHERFDAEFTDTACVGLGWEPVVDEVVEEVAFRTPGFAGWQQERWATHCGDASAYLGQADAEDLAGRWSEAVPAIRADVELSDDDWQALLTSFAKGPHGSPTAYVFRCLHCGGLTGYWDSH